MKVGASSKREGSGIGKQFEKRRKSAVTSSVIAEKGRRLRDKNKMNVGAKNT